MGFEVGSFYRRDGTDKLRYAVCEVMTKRSGMAIIMEQNDSSELLAVSSHRYAAEDWVLSSEYEWRHYFERRALIQKEIDAAHSD